jgi:hypothetical protein
MRLRRGQRQRDERRRGRLGHFRRTACTGALVAGAVTAVATLGAPSAAGQTGGSGFNRGTGNAVAESIRLDPVSGGLSFGIGIGEALAGHQNTRAIAESRAANLGVIGTTLAAEACDGGEPTMPKEDQPQALRIESTEEGADSGRSGQDPKVPGVDRSVRATTSPYAEALTSSGNLDIPGVLSIQGARSFASSGVEGELREAIARTEVGRIIVAGVVELRGLVWEAAHRSGSTEEQVGSFTIGSLLLAGTPVPVDDPTAALSQANELLRPLGLELRPPRFHIDETSNGTLATVDPLGVRVVPSDARNSLLGPLMSQLQPVREDFFNQLIEMDCGNATYITVLDIVLNAFGAGGYFAVELGGVQATTAAIERFSGLGGSGGSLPSLAGNLPASGNLGATNLGSTTGRPGTTGNVATPGAGEIPAADESAAAPETPIDDAVEAAAEGSRGGALAGVGAAGLLLLLATAEGDRRKMRRALREIPMEA